MLPVFGSSCVARVPLHPKEAERLAAVCGVCAPTEGRDLLLDCVADNAAALFEAPIGLVTFIDEREQRFGGLSGADFETTPREDSICTYTILHDGPLIVEDTLLDERFSRLSVVTEAPGVRAYFGAPILDAGGLPLGSVCVLDTKPRSTPFQAVAGLQRLATTVGVILETRRVVRELLDGASSGVRRRSLDRLDTILAPLVAPIRRPGQVDG